MGNTFEVWIWRRVPLLSSVDDYRWHQVYVGEDFDEAMRIMKDEKAKGAGCVKLEWRG